MAYDLWLWLQLRSHSGVWVAKLVLVEQSTQAVLAWDRDLVLKHHVWTVTGSWVTAASGSSPEESQEAWEGVR